ncbi:carboxypeptidase-like regulatory domain-containing protein [Aegicerativicinus sediminis]|uniref:carboxypeptidase-like regulatory domain-containing protein n=1 Tax=Aegicerativicinus sediminis TaxID=2893202 RepID=UPI001E46F1CE|nr:carboxypeptidase-like regulatory domain-containing protein [Aegicerativicinus sediminis]
MKLKLTIFFVLIAIFCQGQDLKRAEIRGRVVVDSNDVEGVTIFNASTNRGTITNERGEFTIFAGLNDRIEISALQFKDITLVIDTSIMKTKIMTVYLVEQVNRLDEVVVIPYGLTGNLRSDIDSVRTSNPNLNALAFGIENSSNYDFRDDYQSSVDNTAMPDYGRRLVNGLNVKNIMGLILKPILQKDKSGPDIAGIDDEVRQIEDIYNIEFIHSNFNIPRDQVDAFVIYARDNGFNSELLEEGQELELLQFLYSKRDEFLKIESAKN